MKNYTICALYKFVSLPNYVSLKDPIHNKMKELQVFGTLLLAHEGINGTIASKDSNIKLFLKWLQNLESNLNPISYKLSYDDSQPFNRVKVKLKKEIVTMGVSTIDPKKTVGTYVKPQDWNQLISDPDVLLIDTRNDYEIELGTFENAVNPNTKTFREFPEYTKKHLDSKKHKKVAMFCTGGIRCEKSTAYLKEEGFEEVYHLEGGILKYLEEIPSKESMWQGDCYVFDGRVSVNHDLEKSIHDLCHACRLPITPDDKQHDHYEQGVSCPKCFGQYNSEQLAKFREREKQVQLAKTRGEEHIGHDAQKIITERKELKKQQKEKQRMLSK